MDLFDDGDDEEGSCKTRVNSIYWGGLWHVSDTTFMEEVVREHLRKSNMQSLSLSAYSHRQDHIR